VSDRRYRIHRKTSVKVPVPQEPIIANPQPEGQVS
jgi:hypothetical protein